MRPGFIGKVQSFAAAAHVTKHRDFINWLTMFCALHCEKIARGRISANECAFRLAFRSHTAHMFANFTIDFWIVRKCHGNEVFDGPAVHYHRKRFPEDVMKSSIIFMTELELLTWSATTAPHVSANKLNLSKGNRNGNPSRCLNRSLFRRLEPTQLYLNSKHKCLVRANNSFLSNATLSLVNRRLSSNDGKNALISKIQTDGRISINRLVLYIFLQLIKSTSVCPTKLRRNKTDRSDRNRRRG